MGNRERERGGEEIRMKKCERRRTRKGVEKRGERDREGERASAAENDLKREICTREE